MNNPPTAPRRWAGHISWRLFGAVGGVALIAVMLLVRWADHDFDALVPGGAAGEPIIYAGTGAQTTPSFHLAGGTYRTHWAAWEKAPEYPPCTHSAELMAVDPANATTSRGHVIDLAKLVHVPATGGSDEGYVINVRPGDYYLAVESACSWQIAITPN